MLNTTIPSMAPILQGHVASLLVFPVVFDDADIIPGVRKCTLEATAERPLLLEFSAEVITAFDGASTNILTVGSTVKADEFLASGDITEGTAGFYPASNANKRFHIVADTDIYVKYLGGVGVGTFTITGTPVAAETLTVNGTVFTFSAAPTLVSEILISAVNATQAALIAAAILANPATAAVVYASSAAGVVTLNALITGAGGNYTLSDAATGVASSSLAGGTTAATAGEANIMVQVTPLFPATATVLP